LFLCDLFGDLLFGCGCFEFGVWFFEVGVCVVDFFVFGFSFCFERVVGVAFWYVFEFDFVGVVEDCWVVDLGD